MNYLEVSFFKIFSVIDVTVNKIHLRLDNQDTYD